MVGSGLRAYATAPPAAVALHGADVRTGAAEHPVCGDRVELDVRLRGGEPGGAAVLDALACRVAGCPASHAIAAVAVEVLRGVAAAAAPDRLRARIAELGGLANHERHAEGMVLRALAQALAAPPRGDGGQ